MSKVVKQYKWEKVRNNYILRLDDNHYISYNPNTSSDYLGAMLDGLIGEGGEETALVDSTDENHKFRILRGNWCDDYERLIPMGFEACVDFFYTKKNQYGGQWSTHEKDRAKV